MVPESDATWLTTLIHRCTASNITWSFLDLLRGILGRMGRFFASVIRLVNSQLKKGAEVLGAPVKIHTADA